MTRSFIPLKSCIVSSERGRGKRGRDKEARGGGMGERKEEEKRGDKEGGRGGRDKRGGGMGERKEEEKRGD